MLTNGISLAQRVPHMRLATSRRPGAWRQKGRRPLGCGVRCPDQGHMPRGAAIRGPLTTFHSQPSTDYPPHRQPPSPATLRDGFSEGCLGRRMYVITAVYLVERLANGALKNRRCPGP